MKNTIKLILNGLIGPVRFQLLKEAYQGRDARSIDLEKRKFFFSDFFTKGDLFFDVGANLGNRIEPILALGGRVVAVEPQKFCSEYLEKKFGKQIIVERKGLSDKPGQMEMFVSDSHTLSTFSPEWIEKIKEARFKHQKWSRKETASMTTLDALIEKYGLPQFIKIDVEGFELEVLKGLSQPIKMISIEYAVPEALENLKSCVRHLCDISKDTSFNYSCGESMEWGSQHWMNGEVFLQFVDTTTFTETGFGDVYVKMLKL